MAQCSAPDKPLVVAKVGRPHGVKGWLRVNSFTSPPENLLQHRQFYVHRRANWLLLEMDEQRWQGDTLVAHFLGYDDPETARELTGLELQIETDSLPELESGEYYWHQLLDLKVVNIQGQLFGKIKDLLETGANDVLWVEPTADSIDQRERLIPFLPDRVVRQVDLENSQVTVDWEADYLS